MNPGAQGSDVSQHLRRRGYPRHQALATTSSQLAYLVKTCSGSGSVEYSDGAPGFLGRPRPAQVGYRKRPGRFAVSSRLPNALFSERKHLFEGFELWDHASFLIRHPGPRVGAVGARIRVFEAGTMRR
jgi:hypothetical protein